MTFFIASENNKQVIVGGRSGTNTSPTLNSISTSTQGEVTIPAEVSYNGNTYRVIQIGQNAFKDCSLITTINIPENITRINNQAFSGCTSIESVKIPNEVQYLGSAFENCTRLESVELGNSLTSISGSFIGCVSLKSIELPSNLQSIGNRTFSGCTYLESVKIGNQIVTLGDFAFENCSKLNNVTLPETLKSIGKGAFYNCSSFTSISLPSNLIYIKNSAFFGCSGITSISIPGKVVSIEDDAFTGCHFTNVRIEDGTDDLTLGYNASLTSGSNYKGLFYLSSTPELSEVYIGRNIICTVPKPFKGLTCLKTVRYGNTVNTIAEGEFYNCSNLKNVEFGNGLTSIGKEAFYGCTSLQSIDFNNCSVSVGEYAFYKCSSLESAQLGNAVTKIGQYAFYQCSSLESIEIPQSAGSVGDYAFYECSNLRSVKIGGVYSIGWNAFYRCSHISTLTLDEGIQLISIQAFYGCSSIKEVVLPASTKVIKANVFTNCTSLEKVTILGSLDYICGFSYCTKLSSISLPEGLKDINENAFSGCSSLTSISLPNTVTNIGQYAFYNCTNLNSLQMSDNLKTIGKYAFQKCGLSSIVIPKTTTTIGEYAFKDCSKLTVVTVENSTPISINSNVFADVVTNATLHVPYSCKSVYQENTVWKMFTTIKENGVKLGDVFKANVNNTTCSFTVTNLESLEVQLSQAGTLTGSLTIPSKVYGDDGTSFFIKSIGENAFSGKGIGALRISEGITAIYKDAFSDCTELTTVTLPKSITYMADAFKYCSNLQSLTVFWRNPSDIQMDIRIFEYITSNSVLLVPAGTKSRYEEIDIWQKFSQIVEVSPISVGDVTTSYGSQADLPIILNNAEVISGIQYKLTLPEGVSLAEEDGEPIVSLTNRTDGFTAMGRKDPDTKNSYLFVMFSLGGNSITGNEGAIMNVKLNISSDVKVGRYDIIIEDVTLATSAFNTLYPAAASSELLIDSNVKKIDFKDANVKAICIDNWDTNGDKELDISEASEVNDLGNVFRGNAEIISFDELQYFTGLKSIGELAFDGCSALTSIEIPKSVTSIGGNAFSGCNLVSISVEEGNSIYDSREKCNAIIETNSNVLIIGCKNTKIPNSVTSIGDRAFKKCSALTSIEIPNSVTSIGEEAFGYCNGLTSVTVNWEHPINISKDVFTNRANATLTVPSGSKSLYKAADYWKEFKEIIDPVSQPMIDDYLSAVAVKMRGGETKTVDILLNNEVADYTAYQFDLTLPEGFTVAKNKKDKWDVTKGERYEDDNQQLTVEMLDESTNTYRILCFSLSNDVIENTEGCIMKVAVKAGDDLEDGDYLIRLKNVTFTRVDGTDYILSDAEFKITINNVVPGDTNGDGTVNVTDIVEMVNYILNKPSASFIWSAADVNGDEQVNVTDIVCTVNIIMSSGYRNTALCRGRMASTYRDLLTMNTTSHDKEISLVMNNESDFVAAQFDVLLSNGLQIKNIHLNNKRSNGHNLVWSMVNENTCRVVVYSLSNNTFCENDGELLQMELMGNGGTVVVCNTTFVNSEMEAKSFDTVYGVTTGIQTQKSDETEDFNYDMNGRRLNQRPSMKGIYIKNGKKYIVK